MSRCDESSIQTGGGLGISAISFDADQSSPDIFLSSKSKEDKVESGFISSTGKKNETLDVDEQSIDEHEPQGRWYHASFHITTAMVGTGVLSLGKVCNMLLCLVTHIYNIMYSDSRGIYSYTSYYTVQYPF